MSLIVTGTIGIDSVYTPGGQAEKVLGGSCTYFSVAASFYTKVRLVAAVGGDFPKAFWKVFDKFPAIDIRGLEVRPASKTFAWGGKYHENMNSRETLFTELGVLLEAAPPVPEAYRDSAVVFLANSHPGVQMGMVSQLPKRKLVVADTMDLWINNAKVELENLLRSIDGVVLNYDEAELLTGKKNPVTAARHMLKDYGGKKGLKFVVVKKGEHGSLVIHKSGIAALPAYPAEKVVDPTGAGDTFAGGMMGYLAGAVKRGGAKAVTLPVLLKAASHGTVAASFNIESFSLDRLMKLKKAELVKRHREFAAMTRIG
jgi:sugar/nucleoside kinase (ribokinase family)